jgi:hypothetical protein
VKAAGSVSVTVMVRPVPGLLLPALRTVSV